MSATTVRPIREINDGFETWFVTPFDGFYSFWQKSDDAMMIHLSGELSDAMARAIITAHRCGVERGKPLGYDQKCAEIRKALCLT